MRRAFTCDRAVIGSGDVVGAREHLITVKRHIREERTRTIYAVDENGKRSVDRNLRLCLDYIGNNPCGEIMT